jgi:hypothetical protein
MSNSHEATIVFIDDPTIKRIYANNLAVTTSQYECNLTFSFIEAPLKPADKVEAKIVAKLMIPNVLVPQVLEVLKKNWETATKLSNPS